jgi:hypothetical protein
MSTKQAKQDWQDIIDYHDAKITLYTGKLKTHNLAKSLAELSLTKVGTNVCVGCDGAGKVIDHKVNDATRITCCVCKGTGKNCG